MSKKLYLLYIYEPISNAQEDDEITLSEIPVNIDSLPRILEVVARLKGGEECKGSSQGRGGRDYTEFFLTDGDAIPDKVKQMMKSPHFIRNDNVKTSYIDSCPLDVLPSKQLPHQRNHDPRRYAEWDDGDDDIKIGGATLTPITAKI